MPFMDGITATKQIRQSPAYSTWSEVKIIGLTANGTIEDRQACFDAGMSDYISKPVKMETIQGILQKHF